MGIWVTLEFSFKVRPGRAPEQIEDDFDDSVLSERETRVLQLIKGQDDILRAFVQVGGDMSYHGADKIRDAAKEFIKENADFSTSAVKIVENDSEIGEHFWYVGPKNKALQAMIGDATERLEATKAHLAQLNEKLQKAGDEIGAWED